ncbi:trypco2 family protein [Streptomyces sp. NRRL S-474]|uniref:trypco2 family protein n=1 Tax=Streptomyces sp. NRRL S-474 TaxID=1463909 RepID=UPI0004C9D0C7|nr:trypco2 family protein [Streptomyces sp. NRRL S-474]
MIELSDMIRELRGRLTTALADGAGEVIRFEAGPVEIEATVAVTREADPNAKVRFWVVDASTKGAYANAQTQRVKLTLTLTPTTVPAAGGPPRPAVIAGDEAPDER